MKVTGAEIVPVRVNFEGVMQGVHVVLRLQTDEGVEGVAYISRIAPHQMKAMCAMMSALAERLVGDDATDPQGIQDKLTAGALGAPVSGLELRAASAFEVAAWDIRGKAAGLPVYKLMGGSRSRVPISANWRLMPGGKADELAAHIENLKQRGFRALKCPVGFASLDDAIAHVKFVRQCAGKDVDIIIDGNFQWDLEKALRFARETEECELYWIEDPLPYHDYEGLREYTLAISQDTCAGEVFQHAHEFKRLIEGRCSDIVMIDQDLGLCGFHRVAQSARMLDLPVVNHLAPETLCHAVAAAPNGLIVGLVPWGQPLFTEKMKVEAGELVMPEAPGLGLALDEDVLKSCRLD